ncbi:MAG: enoyl-CoA hydratase [Proteobacteria bacterium]|nr:enoyl-CoA hydratase [Pseudomonadota bacterium]
MERIAPSPVADAGGPDLLRNDTGGIARLTLNRPEARNALSLALMESLQRELDGIATDDSIRAVVLAANGPAFCAGHDLRQIRENPNQAFYEATLSKCVAVMLAIMRCPKPVIARVQGVASAAGCQLVATCDLAVAATEARFATPGVHIGLFCSTPMVALSRNIGRKEAMEMLLLGEPVSAARAREIGLVNRVVSADRLDSALQEITDTLLAKSPLTLAIGKEAFYRQIEMTTEDAYTYAGDVMVRNMLAEDSDEGISAFLEKRPPVWRGR